MKFETDFTAKDYSDLCWFQAKTITTILSAALALAAAVTLFTIVQSIIISAAIFAVLFPLVYFLEKRSVIKRADRRYAAYSTSDMLYLEIDKDEIRQTSNSGETRLPWQDVYAVKESDSSYYVFLTKNKAFYFPKRSFTSDEQKEKFLEYINEYAPEGKVKLK